MHQVYWFIFYLDSTCWGYRRLSVVYSLDDTCVFPFYILFCTVLINSSIIRVINILFSSFYFHLFFIFVFNFHDIVIFVFRHFYNHLLMFLKIHIIFFPYDKLHFKVIMSVHDTYQPKSLYLEDIFIYLYHFYLPIFNVLMN